MKRMVKEVIYWHLWLLISEILQQHLDSWLNHLRHHVHGIKLAVYVKVLSEYYMKNQENMDLLVIKYLLQIESPKYMIMVQLFIVIMDLLMEIGHLRRLLKYMKLLKISVEKKSLDKVDLYHIIMGLVKLENNSLKLLLAI